MEQAKTCEEYVLSKMTEQEETIDFLNAEIKRLSDIIKNYENPKEPALGTDLGEDAKTIQLSERPNYFYQVNVMSSYQYNEVLAKNGKDPEWLRLALEDDNVLNEFMNLTRETDWHWREPIGEVVRKKYDIIIEDCYGNLHVIEFASRDYTSFKDIDNRSCFLNRDKAKEYLAKEVRETIVNYFKCDRDKEFKKEEDK